MGKDLQLLLSRVDGIRNEYEAQGVFKAMAEELFRKYRIVQGDVRYRFLELEFYYFSDTHQDIKTDGEPFVYKRFCDRPGCFFIHPSGLDICFKTIMNGDEAVSYGGILIRSLLRIGAKPDDRSVISRPWACMDALFNYTDSGTFPRIEEADEPDKNVRVEAARRYNDTPCKLKRPYCFYDSQYHEDKYNWTFQGRKLPEYDPVTKNHKTGYSPKPWNR